MVIGRDKNQESNLRSLMSNREFLEPAMVLEIKGYEALIFIENTGPVWYNLKDLEKTYIREPEKNEKK